MALFYTMMALFYTSVMAVTAHWSPTSSLLSFDASVKLIADCS